MPDRRILAAGRVAYALVFASYAVLTPYLQLYLGARGFGPSRIGLLLSSFELAGIAGPILVTLLADRLQRYRRFIALSLLGSVACFLLLHAIRSAIPLTDALFGRLLDDPARQYGLVRVAGSAVWAVGAAAEVPLVLFTGRIIARFGVRATLTAAVAAITVRLALYGLFPVLAVVVPAQLLHALTFGALHTASGFGGYLVEAAGYRGLFLAYAGVPLLGLAVLAVRGRRLFEPASARLPSPAEAATLTPCER